MGLTLNWKMELPADTPREEVLARLEKLRGLAASLPFAWVEPEICALRGASLAGLREEQYVWGGTTICVKDDAEGVPGIVPFDDEDCEHRHVDPTEIALFRVRPGEGCETADFGVAVFPKTLLVRSETSMREAALPIPESRSWHGESFCKTQFASNPGSGGTEHFVRCHLALVAMLDGARRLGFTIRVNDEGCYWETRDVAVLVRELDRMNHLVAKFAGTCNDALREAGARLTSPVLERHDFEHLEASERSSLPREWKDSWVPKLMAMTAALPPPTKLG